MTYVLKNYQEEFLEAQERVGKEATKDWKSFAQTPAEQLRQIYSQPDFDPETRHYCFKDGELVGFLPSAVLKEEGDGIKRANLEFPIVLPGHEEAEDLLFEKAIKVLKAKGISIVRTRVSEMWGKTVQLAARWGYTFAEELAILYTTDVDTAITKEIPGLEEVTDYDHGRDFEQMVDIFVRDYGMTPEQARTNFETIEKSGQVIAHLVIRKEGKITGRTLVLRYDKEPTRAYTTTIYAAEEGQRKMLLVKTLKKCKEKGIKKLDASIAGHMLKSKDQFVGLYKSFGFTYRAAISMYEKKI